MNTFETPIGFYNQFSLYVLQRFGGGEGMIKHLKRVNYLTEMSYWPVNKNLKRLSYVLFLFFNTRTSALTVHCFDGVRSIVVETPLQFRELQIKRVAPKWYLLKDEPITTCAIPTRPRTEVNK